MPLLKMKRRNSHPTGRASFTKKTGEIISSWLTRIQPKITKSWIFLGVSLVILASFLIWKIYFAQLQGLTGIRTGFVSYYDEAGEFHPAKTLWDLLELFLVPVALSVGVLLFNRAEKNRELVIQERRRNIDLEIAAENRRENLVQKYLDDIGDLLLNENLRDKNNELDSPVVKIAQTKTITVLRVLEKDIKRQNIVFQFLRDSGLGRFLLIGAPLQGVNFSNTDLSFINFNKSNMNKANLSHSTFAGSDFNNANLIEAILIGVQSLGANFIKANLMNADLSNSSLLDVDFSETNLDSVNFTNANFGNALTGSKFVGTRIINVNFMNADLSSILGMDFSNALIQNSNFHGANLLKVNFNNAKLESCDFGEITTCGEILNLPGQTTFVGADLFMVHFHKADMRKADFTNAILNDVNFLEAKITKEQLQVAKINGDITLPNGVYERGRDLLIRWSNSTDPAW